tara:strand:+ start:98 stop:517 length:420 start_codon:yes stop_codon:yes gene_type:complete
MSYKIISKFIKDVSFEIPNIQAFVMLEKEIKNYALNFDIKAKPYKDKIVEVNTTLKISPKENIKDKVLTEITYSALVTIDEGIKDEKEIEKIILINVPTDVYPILYETFVYLFKQAGIKNIEIIKTVDFEKMYKEKKGN